MSSHIGDRPSARAGSASGGRLVLRMAVLLLMGSAVFYLGLSTYIADQLTRPVRLKLTSTPTIAGLAYESVTFASTEDHIPLKGWLIDAPGSDRTIIFLHGRDGIRDDATIGLPQMAQTLALHHYDVLAFDFRAHGESGGERFSLGQWETRDVAGAVRFLQSRGRTSIGAIGWSMGAATVLNSAPDLPELQAIVADSAFADLSDLLQAQLANIDHVPDFFNPGILLMGRVMYGLNAEDNQPRRAVARLGVRPLFLIHGTADQLISVANVTQLQQAGAGDPNLQVWVVPGAAHVRSYQNHPDDYMQRVIAFFDRYLH